jgi:quercetin dioxygenase-like cupin family protein
VSFVKATEKRPAVLGGSAFGYDYFGLTNPSPGQVLQAFIFSFPSEVDKFAFFEHEGEELIHVISGKIEWQVGSIKYFLEAGDTIHFDSRIPHRGHSLSGSATALVVMYSPSTHQSGLG